MQVVSTVPLFVGIIGQSIWFCAIFCLLYPSWFESAVKASNKLYLLGWWGGTVSLFGFIIHSIGTTRNATFFEIGWSMSLILSLSLWWIVWKKMDKKLSKLEETLLESKETPPSEEKNELEEICKKLQLISKNIVKFCLVLWLIQIIFITLTFS